MIWFLFENKTFRPKGLHQLYSNNNNESTKVLNPRRLYAIVLPLTINNIKQIFA